MNAHHLKQYSQLQQGGTGKKMVLHEIIVNRLGLSPFEPLNDTEYVDSAKNGRFHQSTSAIALYTNAFTQKAVFPQDLAPFGYLNKRFGEQFSFGVYQRYDGGLFGCILPLTTDLRSLSEFSQLAMSELPIKGVYVRFLPFTDYLPLISLFNFKPAKEEPWLPDAPEEDESLTHSRVDLGSMFGSDRSRPVFAPLRRNMKRAQNFLDRTGLKYRFVPLTTEDLPIARDIVRMHFEMIEARGKLVGSTYHDYLGLLHPDIISLESVSAVLGFIGSLPISVFITESNGSLNGNPCVSGYAGITLRNVNYLAGLSPGVPLDMDDDIKVMHPPPSVFQGSPAIPSYAFAKLFAKSYSDGYRYFYMGGSEHADIDNWKHKQMGAEKDPTYWAVYTTRF